MTTTNLEKLGADHSTDRDSPRAHETRRESSERAAPEPTNWTWDANGGYWIVR